MAYPRISLLPLTTTDAASIGGTAALTEATPLPRKWWPSQQITKDMTLWITASGRFTSSGTPGTVIISPYLAKSGVAIASAVALVTGPTLTVPASKTNQSWYAEWEIEVLSLGVGGAGVGQMRGIGKLFNVSAALLDMAPATAPMAAVNVDTTADQQVMIGITPSVTTGTWVVHSLKAEVSGT